MKRLLWLGVAVLGAYALGGIALSRGEAFVTIKLDAEAKQILDEALQLIRERREKAAAAAKARR